MALAVVKSKLWPVLGYIPNPAQAQMHAANERFRVFAAGRRTGKSTSGGHELIPKAYLAYFNRYALEAAGNRHEHWIVGPTYTDSEKEFRTFYNDCKRLKMPFDKPGTYYDERSGNMQVSLWEGRFRVVAKSAVKEEQLVGEGLQSVIMAEAAKMKEKIWVKYIRPMLADTRGTALFNSTPEGKNWFYDLWQQGQNPSRTAWWSMRAPSWANTHIFPTGATQEGIDAIRAALEDVHNTASPEALASLHHVDPEIVSMLTDMTPELFNQEVAAQFTEFVGRVFKEFDEEIHVTDLSWVGDRVAYAAVDWGWTNPFVWLLLQVDAFDNVYVLRELYVTEKDTKEVADIIKAQGLCPSGVRYIFTDPAEPDDTHTLSEALRVQAVSGGATGGPLRVRLDLIRDHLRVRNKHLPWDHVDRKPKLLIDRSCKGLIREMNDYRYPERRSEVRSAPEEPMDKDNHGPEALGRFFKGYYGARSAPSRVRKARIS